MKEAVKQALKESLEPVLQNLAERMSELTASVNDRVTVVETKIDDHESRIADLETWHPTGPRPGGGPP